MKASFIVDLSNPELLEKPIPTYQGEFFCFDAYIFACQKFALELLVNNNLDRLNSGLVEFSSLSEIALASTACIKNLSSYFLSDIVGYRFLLPFIMFQQLTDSPLIYASDMVAWEKELLAWVNAGGVVGEGSPDEPTKPALLTNFSDISQFDYFDVHKDSLEKIKLLAESFFLTEVPLETLISLDSSGEEDVVVIDADELAKLEQVLIDLFANYGNEIGDKVAKKIYYMGLGNSKNMVTAPDPNSARSKVLFLNGGYEFLYSLEMLTLRDEFVRTEMVTESTQLVDFDTGELLEDGNGDPVMGNIPITDEFGSYSWLTEFVEVGGILNDQYSFINLDFEKVKVPIAEFNGV